MQALGRLFSSRQPQRITRNVRCEASREKDDGRYCELMLSDNVDGTWHAGAKYVSLVAVIHL